MFPSKHVSHVITADFLGVVHPGVLVLMETQTLWDILKLASESSS